MPYINLPNKEISFKIVYYGPGMSGKTTNLMYIHKTLRPERRGDMVMLNTEEERTLFFDFLPVDLGTVEGYTVRFNMYTVPGQVYYEASRRLVLDDADGVVFVADSQPKQLDADIESFELMLKNFSSYNLDPKKFPVILQYNKRDCENPIPVGVLEKHFTLNGIPVYESVASQGKGVLETARKVTHAVIERFQV